MADARKKAIVRALDDSLTWGYVPATFFVQNGAVELLDPAGRVISLSLNKIKTIAYVKDFNLEDRSDPERIGRRSFLGRPRMEGIWLRLEFTDRQTLEGLAKLDIAFLDNLLLDGGVFVALPDPRSNTQRLFVPRNALASLHVLGFITAPSRAKAAKPVAGAAQGGLFEV